MTESDWLTTTDVVGVLHLVTAVSDHARPYGFRRISDRKLRLFACACCRAVWEQLTDHRSRRAVEVAEKYADGLATEKELSAAHDEADFSLDNLVIHAADCACMGAFDAASDISILPTATQASLLRCIVGNPWRPWCVAEKKYERTLKEYQVFDLDWLTPTVLAVAQSIYDENRWQDTPILADALEDADCANADILDHLRSDGPHARGCHVVDAILGKELHRD